MGPIFSWVFHANRDLRTTSPQTIVTVGKRKIPRIAHFPVDNDYLWVVNGDSMT